MENRYTITEGKIQWLEETIGNALSEMHLKIQHKTPEEDKEFLELIMSILADINDIRNES
jgi:hypothetical protein